MAKSKRIRLTEREYQEILDARSWAAQSGLDATVRYYDELIEFHRYRKALPPSAMQQQVPDEDRYRR